jgi:uncharacterized protein YcfJ
MKPVATIVLGVFASMSFAATARTPSENTSYGYAQVLSVAPVYETRTVETVEPQCLRPERRAGQPVVKIPDNCRPRSQTVRRIVAYDVEYNYKGDTYMSRLDYDPGNRLRVRVSVVPDDRARSSVAPSETR